MAKYFLILSMCILLNGYMVTSKEDNADPVAAATLDATTTEPDITTTPAPTTTTTPAPTTTTNPTTTTPAPPGKFNYNVTTGTGSEETVCIMLNGIIKFEIEYTIKSNSTNKTTIELPKPSSDMTTAGNCSASNQWISISWGPKEQQNTVEFQFGLSKDKKTWSVSTFSATILLDDQFINATDHGKNLELKATIDMKPSSIPVNQSYTCYAKMSAENVTATLDAASPYTHSVAIDIDGIRLQAFNQEPKKDTFVKEVHCAADKASDIVPIAVGCALGGLVVVVLIAYIVGRRRRSAAYQSV